MEILKLQRDNNITESKIDSVILHHMYRTILKLSPKVTFKSADEAMIHLTLLSYLLDSVDAEHTRPFIADMIRTLHTEICNSEESKIDHFLSSTHYEKLLEIVNKLGRLGEEFYIEGVDSPNSHRVLL